MNGFAAVAAIAGFSAVAIGAFGAHALKLEGAAADWFETANRYHFYHALALLALAFSQRHGLLWNLSAYGWIAGILIFSGSLYAMALGAPRWLGAIAPIGGTALLFGWACLFIAAWRYS
ncbi:MAG: DUF423 domain-containing protein [Wenzhouxiangellaceae bacterium]